MRLRGFLKTAHCLTGIPSVRVAAGKQVGLRDPDAILVLPEQDFFLRDNHGGSVSGPEKSTSLRRATGSQLPHLFVETAKG